MQCSLHPASRTIYVTTRKVASQTLETNPEFESVWVDPKNLKNYKNHSFCVITRDPTDRFLSMYSFLQEIYAGGQTWDSDWIYRERFTPVKYRKFFCNPRWRELPAVIDFAELALPELARTRDLHWRSQIDRLRQTGVIDLDYTRVPVNHLSRWLYNRHGISTGRVNSKPFVLKGLKHTFHLALDERLRRGAWREDYALHEG